MTTKNGESAEKMEKEMDIWMLSMLVGVIRGF